MARKSNDTLILVLVTVGLFALSCAMRFFLADFQKGIGVLPDEIRYLDLASSLFNDGQLVERGGLSSFQKILYPLSLFPAFLVDDPETRVRVIALLNSIYVSSAVFPALVLARRLFTSKAPVIVCLVFTLVMPDMCYSMTFLSECIYLPLVLWLVACCLRAIETRGRAGYAWCAGAGLLCYVTYLAKEVALGFALAFIVMMVVLMLVMIIPQRRRDKKIKQMLAAIKTGDRVRTIGGIYGTVTNVKDDVITISVGPDRVQLVFARGAIANVEDVAVENTMDDGAVKS